LSNLTPRVQRHPPPPKIYGLPGMLESSDDDMEEEKEELSNELVVGLKQKITALEEQVTELHLQSMTKRMTFACFVRPPLAS
jgi:hypothetical protein